MEADHDFCPECGTPAAPAEASAEQSIAPYEASEPQARQKAPLPKKMKISILCGLLIVVLLAGVYWLGQYTTDENRLIDRFALTAAGGKPDKLFALLDDANADIPFDRPAADKMAAYFKSHPDDVQKLVDRLKAQADSFKSQETGAAAFGDESFIYLAKKNKKRWFIFDDYELKIKRYMLSVRSNYQGADIFVDGQKSAKTKEDGQPVEIGPLLPGLYEVKAVFAGDYTQLENKASVALFPLEAYDETVDLELDGEFVSIYSNNMSARIFINGEDSELMVGDGVEVGPIAIDGSNKVHLEAEYPWGKVKSEELVVDASVLEFRIDGMNESVREDIMTAAHSFLASWIEAFQAQDESLLRDAHPDRRANLVEYIADMKYEDQQYSGRLHAMTFDLDSFALSQSGDGVYSVTVDTKVDYSEIMYVPVEGTDAPVPETGTNLTRYELIYQDGKWLVRNWYSSPGIGTNTHVVE